MSTRWAQTALCTLAVAGAALLGTAVADPVAGELRRGGRSLGVEVLPPFGVYAGLAFVGLAGAGRWPLVPSVALATLAGAIAVAVERPKVAWFDDDLAMTLIPAVVLYALGVLVLGL